MKSKKKKSYGHAQDTPVTRRHFLRGLGGFTLAIPLLPSLLKSTVAHAQAANAPKRYFFFGTRNGIYELPFYPDQDPSLLANGQNDVRYQLLSNIQGDLSQKMKRHFDGLRDKMNIYRGLDLIGGSSGHGTCHMLTGCSPIRNGNNHSGLDENGKSIDVIMAESPNFYSTNPNVRALRAHNQSPYNYSISWDRDSNGSAFRHPFKIRPTQLFDQAFGAGVNVDPAVQASLNSKKTDVASLVLEEYNRLKNHRRISSVDKIRLDNHMEHVFQTHTNLNNAQPVSCSTPNLVSLPNYQSQMSETQKRQFWSNYIDVIVAAMACDITRIGVLYNANYHLNHETGHLGYDNQGAINTFIDDYQIQFSILSEMATKMNNFVDTNGQTMLDNSIVHFSSENSESHQTQSMPAITFGSANGAINTGYYMDYRQQPLYRKFGGTTNYKNPAIGRSYTQLLITIMKAMGLQQSDYHQWGDGGGFGMFNTNSNSYNSYWPNHNWEAYRPERNNTLPFISNVA